MTDKSQEIITAYKTESLLHPFNYLLQGYHDDPDLCRNLVRHLKHSSSFVDWQRSRLEDNAAFQQPIPYIVVIAEDIVLTYIRAESGDKRLLRKASIGFGGHVNLDQDGSSLTKAARRELTEELLFDGKTLSEEMFVERTQPLGILKDWRDPVGAVHLGVVMSFDATGLVVTAREKGIILDWSSNPGNPAKALDMEGWSQMIINKYNEPGKSPPWIRSTVDSESSSRMSQGLEKLRSSSSSSPLPVSRKRPARK